FTAALAVTRFGNVQPGERVLVHNAGGGVGIAAIQIAKNAGAHVIGTASGWKHDKLRELGADELIDYRKTDWPAELQKLTKAGGAHLIIDPIGGKNLKHDLDCLAPLGRLVAFGLSESVSGSGRSFLSLLKSVMRMPRPGFVKLLSNNWSIAGLNLGHLWGELDRLRVVGDEVIEGWNDGYLKPVIAAEVPFETPAEAHRLLEERKNIGKVLLVV
ncbi:MAG: zinc-binding dehydrogenase, partial [Spirochaetales bacterium]